MYSVKTNADYIRSMTDEELADWLIYYAHDGYMIPDGGWDNWLKQIRVEMMGMDKPSGLKYDAGKPRLDLIPPEAILAIGKVMTYGADKYGANNWQGVAPDRYVAALLRHLMAYRMGELCDPESTMPHLWHVLANAAFLVTLAREE